MFCKKCGMEIEENVQFCNHCGAQTEQKETHCVNAFMKQEKCLPAFILGLIGSIFALFGGFCTTMCTVLSFFGGNATFILIFCGSIIGIVGACLCLSRNRLGSSLELLSALMIMLCAFGRGAGLMCVFGFLLLLAGGIIGMVFSFIKK